MKIKEELSKLWESVKWHITDQWDMSWDTIHRILVYLRLEDEKGRMSLTNLAMMIMLYKIATTQATSITDLTTLAVTIVGYHYKKHLEAKAERESSKE